jgi:hypothetical protein
VSDTKLLPRQPYQICRKERQLSRICASPVLSLERLLWMPAISNDGFWRQRAAEMRAIADGLAILPNARASILRFAEEYDRLAERAAEPMNGKDQAG